MAGMRSEDRATGVTPASRLPLGLAFHRRGGEDGEPFPPRRREDMLRSSFTESAEPRWVPAIGR